MKKKGERGRRSNNEKEEGSRINLCKEAGKRKMYEEEL